MIFPNMRDGVISGRRHTGSVEFKWLGDADDARKNCEADVDRASMPIGFAVRRHQGPKSTNRAHCSMVVPSFVLRQLFRFPQVFIPPLMQGRFPDLVGR
jgi:hypothetical protein